MPTKPSEILSWLKDGQAMGATHLLIICDTFVWEDFPVYVTTEPGAKSVQQAINQYRDNAERMTRIMEVYRINDDWRHQLAERRCWNV